MTSRGSIRPAALAGRWYPADARALADAVRGYVREGARDARAIVVPHAGYVYSGPTAGIAWGAVRTDVRRVVMVGPAHRVAFHGIALGDYAAFATPLCDVPVDRSALNDLERAGLGTWVETAHVNEHCLEIQLPFLLATLGPVPIVPLLMGRVSHANAVRALEAVLADDDLLVLSSDLSHFDPYDVARAHDLATLAHIVALDAEGLDGHDACGHRGVGAGAALARERGWNATLLDYRSSGDTAGDKAEVVGYGAVAFV